MCFIEEVLNVYGISAIIDELFIFLSAKVFIIRNRTLRYRNKLINIST